MKKATLFLVIIFCLGYNCFGITLGVGVYNQRLTMNNITFDTVKVDQVVENSIASHFIRSGDNIIYVNVLGKGSVYEEPTENTIQNLNMRVQSQNANFDNIRMIVQYNESVNKTKLKALLSAIEPQEGFGVTILRNGRFIDYWIFYD